ncbi:MAG TPA: CapA family protein, partial [Spirochaetales bacterium]|nr:CapA family protein [Spirochaetales bacterium]
VFLAYAEPIWSARGARADARSMRVTRAELLGHGTNIQLGFSPDSDDGERSPAGLAHASIADMQADMEAAKRELQPDYLFVSVHWGDEHQHYPTAAQRAFGRAAIDAGAAAVLGHHPHVLQGVEFYNGGFILYSMGNFVFDMMADTTYRTAAFHLHLKDGSVDSVVAQPVSIERFAYAPAPATGSTALSIARDIQRWSAYLGTNGTITEAGSVLFSR